MPPYALRHAFGCFQGSARTNQAVIAAVMGHSNIKTTSRYILNLDDACFDAVNAVDATVGKIMAMPVAETQDGSPTKRKQKCNSTHENGKSTAESVRESVPSFLADAAKKNSVVVSSDGDAV